MPEPKVKLVLTREAAADLMHALSIACINRASHAERFDAIADALLLARRIPYYGVEDADI